MPWNSDPEILGAFDAAMVRCIAGELTEETAAATLAVDVELVWRRIGELLREHFEMTREDLVALPLGRRRRLAEEIVDKAEDQREAANFSNVEPIVPKHPHPRLTVVSTEEPDAGPDSPEAA